jgi:ankyrin repeat protein
VAGFESASKAGRSNSNSSGFEPGPDGKLADPYRTEADQPHNAPRTTELILQQALMFACLHGRQEVVEFLLGKGADPSRIITGLDVNCAVMHKLASVDTFGATRKREETEELRLPMVRFLLECGYDRDTRDQQHNATALGWAEHAGAARIAAALTG